MEKNPFVAHLMDHTIFVPTFSRGYSGKLCVVIYFLEGIIVIVLFSGNLYRGCYWPEYTICNGPSWVIDARPSITSMGKL